MAYPRATVAAAMLLLAAACSATDPAPLGSGTSSEDDSGAGPDGGVVDDAGPMPPEPLTFPRIASYFIETYLSAEQADVMARADVAVVDVEASALSADTLASVRAKNPGGELLAYLTSEEIAHAIDPEERPLAAARFAQIAPSEWLLEPGSALSGPVSATTTRIGVVDGSAFTVLRPESDFYEEDEPTFLLVDGEHMRLVDVEGDELVVERGYQSTATAHAAGAKAAAHVVFFAGTWMLDLAATAPKSASGTTWRDRLVDDAVALVKQGPWTGIFLDVCFEDVSWLNGGLLDVDRDGIADDPLEASKQWSLGFGLVVDALRSRLGPNVPIVANPGAQNCPHAKLDGILLEGWPIGLPPDYLDFDRGLARYLEWAPRGRHMTIANAFSPKIGFGTIEPGADEEARTDWPAMRFGLGVALLGDGLYAFDNGVFGHYVTWWYDEYDGAGAGRGWLGHAKGPPVANGTVHVREFEQGVVVVNTGSTEATVPMASFGPLAKLQGIQDPLHNDGEDVGASLLVRPKDSFVLRRR